MIFFLSFLSYNFIQYNALNIIFWQRDFAQKSIVTGAITKTYDIGDYTNYTPATVAFNNVTT